MSGVPQPSSSPTGLTQGLEQLYERFEQAWHAGERPAIADFLPPTEPARARALVELALIDLECRLKGGEEARVETYVESYPELALNPAAVLDLIGTEYRLRGRREGEVCLEEYLERFPDYQGALVARLGGGLAAAGAAATDSKRGESTDPGPGGKAVGGGAPAAPGAKTPDVPGYEVLGELGRGGMGVVYKARQLALGRLVALKMLRDETLAEPADLARFRKEAETVARLRHPNVVPIYEVREGPDHPYFTMEFVEGGTLSRRIGGRPQPPAEAARLAETLARAVHAVHACGVIHRDLKPGNVLLTADGTPKVVDFGLARRLEGEAGSTSVGRVVGTPSYMAPEQARGDTRAVSAASDVYALGAVLYEMLTGRPPFQGATGWDTIAQVLSQEPVPPRRLQPRVPADLETICLKCLRKEPARRYASAALLADDLARFGRGEPILARPTGPAERAWKWARRRPAVAALLGALVVVVLGSLAGLTALWLRAQRERDRAEERFHMALEVVDKLKNVSESDELRARGLEDWRRQLLESATGFYDRFSRSVAGDPALRAEHARASRQLGRLLEALGRHDKAETAFRQALATFRALGGEYRGDTAEGLQSLASLYQETGHADQAEGHFREALALREELAGARPGDATNLEGLVVIWNGLGLLYRDTERDDRAVECWEKARDLVRELLAQHPNDPSYLRKLAIAQNNLGSAFYQAQRWDPCEKAYDEALKLCRQLADARPKDPESQSGLADAHGNLGLLYTATARPDRAERAFGEARRLLGQLVETHPDVPDYRQSLARAANNLGDLCTKVERYGRAEEAFREARDADQRLASAHPQVPEYERDLGLAEYNLAEVYRYTGRTSLALATYRQAQERFERLLKGGQESLDNKVYLAAILTGRGGAARVAGELAEAVEWDGRAVSLLESVLEKNAGHGQAEEVLRTAGGEHAAALARQGRREEAARALKRVEELDKGKGALEVHLYRAQVWARTGDPGKAAEEAAATARDPEVPARTLYDLAGVCAACATALAAPDGPAAGERRRRAEACAAEAVTLLRRARDAGYFRWPGVIERLRTDPDLAPLASRPDYQRFLRELLASPAVPAGSKGPHAEVEKK
jgi:serine/threonine-protein kinase